MALQADLQDKIIQAVADGFDDQIAFTQELVRMPSLRGHEHPIQDFVHRALQSRGYAMDRFYMDREAIAAHPGGSKFSDDHSDAPIVVGIHRPREEKGRSLILQSHLDVVPEGLHDMWSDAPFSARIEGDWMYGRGAGDMKAGAAANIFALDALRRIGLQPAATVYVQSVVEEESTGNGALQTFLQGYTADAVFIPEPEEEMLVRANTGVLWFQVQVRGVPVHVREMGEGANAIDGATRIMAVLREMEEDWNAEKGEHPHFEDEAHPINLNIGKIEGGDWASSVPSWCNIDCRVSIYPGRSADDAAREITERIAAFAQKDSFLSNNPPKVVFNGFHAEGYVLEPGTEAEAVLGRAHESAIGAPLESFMTAGYLDTRVYALYNKIPALCYGPKSRNIHGIDECVSLESVKRITAAMALFIAEWCGTEAADA
ncbi:acetylornithine deacetylase [Pelagivirga sediminicola]|uniref:Acetylornithine deacetylase n=1 Tax=Pelagivirga sediminicola TaxID=2170575 RepID=A0A2T7G3Y6_9RHOB|nr:ArgE/DapE family deacylase [Pelagivirga sediminicola]PVA09118.1 acetylornithine deacetylase [Pelagivirga sediminicola]